MKEPEKKSIQKGTKRVAATQDAPKSTRSSTRNIKNNNQLFNCKNFVKNYTKN